MRIRFRFITFASLILAGTIAVLAIKSAAGEMGWQTAAQSAPPGLMQQIIQENFKLGFAGNTAPMKVWKIMRSVQAKPLFLIDTRTGKQAHANPLCGALGCQFLGYIPVGNNHYQRVLTAYFKPQLPPHIALIEPTPSIHNGLPTLKINQLEGKQIRQLTFAFNGKVYSTVESQLLPKVYE